MRCCQADRVQAWEFKHPDFKMNNKDALDNIRRKAPAPRKPNQPSADDMLVPSQQMDMVSGQLMATQAQLHAVEGRYNELSIHHSMLLQEVIGLQKTVVNHEHVMPFCTA
jgi:osomolarity two-component system response regulator SKN7